ncbi:cache domain-containing protein [Siccirubricoccus deserti]
MRTLTLLARLFLLVALALLPAVLQIYGAQVQLREQRTQAARDQALRLARDASARLGRFVEGLREALVVLAEAPPIRSGDPVACTAMLVQLRDRFAQQVLLGVVDPEGWLLCTTLGTPPRTIYDGDRSFFRLAMERGEVVVSEWEPAAPFLRGGSVHFGLPIRGAPGQPPLGAVGAAVGVDWLADLLRPIGLPPGATLTVVDREARVMLQLTDTPGLALRPGTPAPQQLLELLPPFSHQPNQQEPDAVGTVVDGPGWDGSPCIYGAAPFVPATGGALRLVVSLDAARALAPVEAAARAGIILMLGVPSWRWQRPGLAAGASCCNRWRCCWARLINGRRDSMAPAPRRRCVARSPSWPGWPARWIASPRPRPGATARPQRCVRTRRGFLWRWRRAASRPGSWIAPLA